MADWRIRVTPSICQQCPKHCNLEELAKDPECATNGTTKQIRQAGLRAKITKTLNKNVMTEKRNPYDFFLTLEKCNRQLNALNEETTHLPLGIDLYCYELKAGKIHVLADVIVENLVPVETHTPPTFETYQYAFKNLTDDQKNRLYTREQWPTGHLEKFQKPMPNVRSATAEFLAKIEEQHINEHLFNELSETLRLFVEEPERKWKEELQATINAIEKMAHEDARKEVPTEEERLAVEADAKLGKMTYERGVTDQ